MYNLCFSTERRILKCTDINNYCRKRSMNKSLFLRFFTSKYRNIERLNFSSTIHIIMKFCLGSRFSIFRSWTSVFECSFCFVWHFSFLIPIPNAYYFRKILRFCCKLDNGDLIRTRNTTRNIFGKKRKEKLHGIWRHAVRQALNEHIPMYNVQSI